MKKFLIAAVAIISLSAFTTFQKKQKVVFFGDSITQAGVKEKGYITVLGDLLSKSGAGANFELNGAGVSGNKVYDLYLRIEEDVMAKSPDVVIIWVGVNDVWHKQSSGTGTDADKFERFYNAIIKKLQSKNINVMLCTPAAIGERTDFTNQLDGDLNRYSTIIRNIASKTNCKLIDLRRVFLDYNLKNNAENKESGILTTDRVHLNDAGNLVVAQEMMKALTGK